MKECFRGLSIWEKARMVTGMHTPTVGDLEEAIRAALEAQKQEGRKRR